MTTEIAAHNKSCILQHALHNGEITFLFQFVDLWAQHSCNNSEYSHCGNPQCYQGGSGGSEDTWGRGNRDVHLHLTTCHVTTVTGNSHLCELVHQADMNTCTKKHSHSWGARHCLLLVHDHWLQMYIRTYVHQSRCGICTLCPVLGISDNWHVVIIGFL